MLIISEIIQLKQELAEKHSVVLSYHDVCPKPFFTLGQTGEKIRSDITAFLHKRGYSPNFAGNGLQFTVERGI